MERARRCRACFLLARSLAPSTWVLDIDLRAQEALEPHNSIISRSLFPMVCWLSLSAACVRLFKRSGVLGVCGVTVAIAPSAHNPARSLFGSLTTRSRVARAPSSIELPPL